MNTRIRLIFVITVALFTSCSVREFALNSVADALSGDGGGYGTYDDPVFISHAAPFGLTVMENIADKLPKHRDLRLTLASGYVQYAYAFVQQEADVLEHEDISRAKLQWERAKHFYLRARGHALDALEMKYPGVKRGFLKGGQGDWDRYLTQMKPEDVPYLYWTAASWALVIAVAKDEPNYFGDLSVVFAIMKRAFFLNEAWDHGTLHEFFVSTGAAMAQGNEEAERALAEAKFHKRRAMMLSKGSHLGVLVSYAENVLVPAQAVVPKEIEQVTDPILREQALRDQAARLHQEFLSVLEHVCKVDIYQDDPAFKEKRLANVIARKRAEWLLSRHDKLFAD